MKRLWIRAQALNGLRRLAIYNNFSTHEYAVDSVAKAAGPNDMVVVEVSDTFAVAVAESGYLMAAGRVLKDGEEPPYLGEKGKQTR